MVLSTFIIDYPHLYRIVFQFIGCLGEIYVSDRNNSISHQS